MGKYCVNMNRVPLSCDIGMNMNEVRNQDEAKKVDDDVYVGVYLTYSD